MLHFVQEVLLTFKDNVEFLSFQNFFYWTGESTFFVTQISCNDSRKASSEKKNIPSNFIVLFTHFMAETPFYDKE